MKVLELFSGIGGMHFSLDASGVNAEVIAAADINTVANTVYRHNFPKTKLYERNIQSFSVDTLNKISPDIILMSPPCQPFTRVGLKKDVNDERTSPLLYILNVIPKIEKLKYILLENVKGFENSEARDRLVQCLQNCGFVYQEFILCPTQIGVPNSRSRYYLIARKSPRKFCFETSSEIMENFPHVDLLKSENISSNSIADIINCDADSDEHKEYLIPDEILLKRGKLMDIVTRDFKRSCCFTKAYGHYVEGTGSVYCPFKKEVVENIKNFENYDFFDKIKELNLRYFSPSEISKLMNFPEKFSFPNDLSKKQKYRLLGNSLNVKVVSLLIKILLYDD